MKISIENFKSISKLNEFEIKPLTILSGVNSAGKSSFVQFLMLLKQTIELDSSRIPFFLRGEYYDAKSFKDIISFKDTKKKLKFSFIFSKTEIESFQGLNVFSVFKTFKDYECVIDIEYSADSNLDAFVSSFAVNLTLEEGKSQHISITSSDKETTFSIDTNTGLFGTNLYAQKLNISNVVFSSFYPIYYNYIEQKTIEVGDRSVNDTKSIKALFEIEDIKKLINTFLENISYIGPNRFSPQDNYHLSSHKIKDVGIDGKHTAQILCERATYEIDFFKVVNNVHGITYEPSSEKLVAAVRYWICSEFDIANDIRSEKISDSYKIVLTSKLGLETSIKHVGFGISQLLPIIVQGLLLPNFGTLIIEQPEIHLHPKLQSKLYDFLYSLIKSGKKVIVETHSSHFITRMRRRIAEDSTDKMDNNIGLTFVESNIFRSINLNDYGALDYYPEDFIEASNSELKAIVEAQMRKRRLND